MVDDWYVAIIGFSEMCHYSLIAPCSEYYKDFKDIVAKGTGKIVAEVFNVRN